MDSESAVKFLAGMLGGWLGIDAAKPKRGEREILTRFGERVMLAWLYMEEELRDLRKEQV
jgi:hypothetical protein